MLSAKMKSPYFVLIILVPVLFIPMFLTPNGTTGAYNLALFLLPYRATMPEFSKCISYQFGSRINAAVPNKSDAAIFAVVSFVFPYFADKITASVPA